MSFLTRARQLTAAYAGILSGRDSIASRQPFPMSES